MIKCLSIILAAVLIIAGSSLAMAQILEEVHLGAVEVTAPKDTINTVTQVEIERKNANNIWQALSGVPGVTQMGVGGRGETAITIRGSNTTQVGMYIDDIPVATAYRNQFDFNDVMVFDTETIEVSKGFSTTLLNGGFGLAGILNVKTHKPVRPFEFKVQFKNYFDSTGDNMGEFIGVRVGTKQEKFYFQVSAAQDQQDFFRLSHSFNPGYFESGGRRVNSDFRNRRLNVIAGLTPTEDIDIMVGTVQQDFVKGMPVTAEADPANLNLGSGFGGNPPVTRLWRWPVYRTQRYFVNANADIGQKTHVQLLGYLDEHKDMIESYDRLIGKKPVHQIDGDTGYDQYTAGLRGKVDYEINPANKFSLSLGYRELSHKEHADTGGPIGRHIKEHYWDVGGEYTLKPMDRLTTVLGLSYSRRTPDIVEDRINGVMVPLRQEDRKSNDLFDWQLGLFYDLPNTQQIFFTYARKSRFPSMWERFQRNTRFLPPDVAASLDLQPEEADHFEIGYRGTAANFLKFTVSAFYSNVTDKIVMVSILGNAARYAKNIDKVKTWGFETGVDMTFNKYVAAGATLSLLDWETKTASREDSLVTDVPKVQGSLYAVIAPTEKLSITAQANLRSSFYISSDPSDDHHEAPGFVTADLKIGYDFNEHISAEIGAKNIFDKNYYYNYYYPQAGRTFFLGLTGTY
ncbi:MAG: TonB-dependent receptor [Deltaproteobacteria bacterium]|jgi:iron complex outermembrane receptor protein|nr:TonB-dependent receptor [Deltaproteobacteria bacterium]